MKYIVETVYTGNGNHYTYEMSANSSQEVVDKARRALPKNEKINRVWVELEDWK